MERIARFRFEQGDNFVCEIPEFSNQPLRLEVTPELGFRLRIWVTTFDKDSGEFVVENLFGSGFPDSYIPGIGRDSVGLEIPEEKERGFGR
jgi:hypothetical protein